MRILISVSLLLFSITSFGNSRGRIIDNISRVASRVQVAVLDSELSNSELLEVQRELSDIVSRLNNRGGGSSVSCLEFTLDIFERRYSGSTALRKAQEACRKINDTALVEYVFNREWLVRVIYVVFGFAFIYHTITWRMDSKKKKSKR